MITLATVPLDAEVLVQIGKGKGTYTTRYYFRGSTLNHALFYYHGLNIGRGYKKRLYLPESRTTLLRQTS